MNKSRSEIFSTLKSLRGHSDLPDKDCSSKVAEDEIRQRARNYYNKANDRAMAEDWTEAENLVFKCYDTIWSNIEAVGAREVDLNDIYLLLDSAGKYSYLVAKIYGVEENLNDLSGKPVDFNENTKQGLHVLEEVSQFLCQNSVRTAMPDVVGACMQNKGGYECVLGNYPEAIDKLHEATKLRSDKIDIAFCEFMLGVAYYRNGNLIDSEKHLVYAEDHHPFDISKHLRRVRNELKMK